MTPSKGKEATERRIRRLPMIFAVSHLAILAAFFWSYRSSQDPNRGMCILLWMPLDPLAMVAVIFLLPLASYETADAWAFCILATLGTLQWYLIGRLIRHLAK